MDRKEGKEMNGSIKGYLLLPRKFIHDQSSNYRTNFTPIIPFHMKENLHTQRERLGAHRRGRTSWTTNDASRSTITSAHPRGLVSLDIRTMTAPRKASRSRIGETGEQNHLQPGQLTSTRRAHGLAPVSNDLWRSRWSR